METPAFTSIEVVAAEIALMNRSFERLTAELRNLTDAEIGAFRLDNWPRGEHWAGQDGSIAGIIRHTSAWKAALASALCGEAAVDLAACGPTRATAENLLRWLNESHTKVLGALASQSPETWPYPAIMEGLDLLKTVRVLSEHDRYHAAQVAYLRDRYRAGKGI